jgi:transposase
VARERRSPAPFTHTITCGHAGDDSGRSRRLPNELDSRRCYSETMLGSAVTSKAEHGQFPRIRKSRRVASRDGALPAVVEAVSQRGSVRGVQQDFGMPQNFIESRREQGFLLPPDVRDWLAPDHLAWFVIDAVKQMSLGVFYAAYRADGHGRAAYEPWLMVTLVLYAFASGVRSSRAIERHCRENVAFRVITGNLVFDHVTVARFICRHQRALSELFTGVLRICDRAGLITSGVVSIDGTRIAGNANPDVNFQFEQIAREVLAEVRASDEAEDQKFGQARGDELPEELRTADGRREFLRQARRELDREQQSEDSERIEDRDGEPEAEESGAEEPEPAWTPSFSFDSAKITDAGGGRRRWLQEARSQLEQHRWDHPDPIVRSRIERLLWRSSAWRPSCPRSAPAMRRMRATAGTGGCATVLASAARPIRTGRRSSPRAR